MRQLWQTQLKLRLKRIPAYYRVVENQTSLGTANKHNCSTLSSSGVLKLGMSFISQLKLRPAAPVKVEADFNISLLLLWAGTYFNIFGLEGAIEDYLLHFPYYRQGHI